MADTDTIARLRELAAILPTGSDDRRGVESRLVALGAAPTVEDVPAPAGDYADLYPEDIPWADLDAVLDELRAEREARVVVHRERMKRPDWDDPGDGQVCWLCGHPCMKDQWELHVMDGRHRFVCAGRWWRRCRPVALDVDETRGQTW